MHLLRLVNQFFRRVAYRCCCLAYCISLNDNNEAITKHNQSAVSTKINHCCCCCCCNQRTLFEVVGHKHMTIPYRHNYVSKNRISKNRFSKQHFLKKKNSFKYNSKKYFSWTFVRKYISFLRSHTATLQYWYSTMTIKRSYCHVAMLRCAYPTVLVIVIVIVIAFSIVNALTFEQFFQ